MPEASGDGCGLGLSIVQEIASLHDAQVEVTQAENGQGAKFTVIFREAPGATRSTPHVDAVAS